MSITFRMNERAKTGSIPLLQPAMMLMVPVGAIVVVVALRRGTFSFSGKTLTP